MQVKQVIFEIARTHNLGNYNNVKPTARVVIDLEEGNDPDAALRQARLSCQAQIDAAIAQAEGKPEPAQPSPNADEMPF